MERFLTHAHLDQHVAGVQLPLHRDLLAVLDFDDVLHGDQGLTDQFLVLRTRVVLDPLLEQVTHLVLVSGRRLDRVPAVFHDLTARAARLRPRG